MRAIQKRVLGFLRLELQVAQARPPAELDSDMYSWVFFVFLFLFLFFWFFETGFRNPGSPGCPGTHSVDQAGLELILLPLPPKCWD
ncbi:mCG147845 [Mus musculus]|nr:mCG147845 [Mus musculus]